MDEEKSGSNTLQKDALLNCWTSSSDISGYHADFHEGHDTVGAGQGRGMACVNRPKLVYFSARFSNIDRENCVLISNQSNADLTNEGLKTREE